MRAKLTHVLIFGLAVIVLMPGISDADDNGSFWEQIQDGDFSLSFRYRYEFVDQDNISNDANASTLRTRLGYVSPTWDGWSFMLEADDVHNIGNDLYNSTTNGESSRPVVADPEGTEINQAWLQLVDDELGRARLGRQRIIKDNARFIGNVGWRQNEQTYDALGLNLTAIENFNVDYAYIQNVNRIFGPDGGGSVNQAWRANWSSNSHILNANYSGFGDTANLTGYAYLLDIESADAQSSQTYGLRMTGNRSFDKTKLVYSAEAAHQSDYADNPNSYSANYYLIEAGLVLGATSIKDLTFKAGFEVLQGDSTSGEQFRTPLATLHKFQGWADQFLSTPDGGIEDLYLSTSGSLGKTKLTLVYHDFDGESAGGSLGSEWDFSAARRLGKYANVLLKYAAYDADNHSVDVDKAWLMFTSNFK